MNNPALLVLLIAAGVWLGWLWQGDRRVARAGKPAGHALPGATDVPVRALVIAVGGALLLLAAETAGEFALGIARDQSHMTWLFALYSVASAPLVEETIFRGYLVVDGRGAHARWMGVLGASVGFALLHPFLWQWDAAGFALTLGLKNWFSFAVVFATSVWFYVARFAAWNPRHSLLPCFAGHAAKNAGVVAIKAALGFMGPLW
jgi:uncharacterized protein